MPELGQSTLQADGFDELAVLVHNVLCGLTHHGPTVDLYGASLGDHGAVTGRATDTYSALSASAKEVVSGQLDSVQPVQNTCHPHERVLTQMRHARVGRYASCR